MKLEAFAHEGNIRSPGEVQRLGCFGQTKNLEERLLERFHTRATGANERSIDIE